VGEIPLNRNKMHLVGDDDIVWTSIER